MLIAERRRRILDHLRLRGYASFRDLADALGASESTVRRDLRAMADEGLLRATRGGAGPLDGADAREPGPSRPDPVPAERSAIAATAAALIEPGSAVLLGPGRTTRELARRLTTVGPLTVVTNSVLVTTTLLDAGDAGDVDVVLLGGALRRSIQACVGPITEQNLRELRGAQVFVSGEGVTVERGLTTPNVFAAATDAALVAAARQVVVLADHTKLGRDTMCQTVPTARMDVLVTDAGADAAQVRALAAAGVDVRLATPDTAR
ncbi:MAG TPA: DeoR/GlpR family DNA-binding transcription regulator [Pilimelia sp.]|nr:DeoR/GlpR family DNA-binding transcription regulator [Pilimelia sp.]